MSNSAKTRAVMACCGLAVCFTGFSARLVYLQVTKAEQYTTMAVDKHTRKESIPARRGVIFDVNGEPLAQNELVRTVVADGSLIDPRDREILADVLCGPLEMPRAEVLEKLAAEKPSKKDGKMAASRYIVLKKRVHESAVTRINELIRSRIAELAEGGCAELLARKTGEKKMSEKSARELALQIAQKKFRGLNYEPDAERSYPNGQMLCHVVGYVNNDNVGVEGVELTMNPFLRGYDGFRLVERDRTGRELVAYRGQERAPRDGNSVHLTVDLNLQQIVEEEIEVAVKQYKPKMVTVILMRPQTGEILAMANWPHFDPNKIELSQEAERRNRAITDMVEPGSTFKIVTTASALTMKLVNRESKVFCENGAFTWGGKVLHDHKGYGELSIEDVLVHSSNIGVAKLGIQMGEQRLYDSVRKFGFGERTGISLPGEIPGVVHPLSGWSKVSITHVPMGQEVGATPLQVVTAMGAIANGGTLMMPQIVHSIHDSEGHLVQDLQRTEVRRVASPEAVAIVREALVRVVSKKGTAPLAHVPGFQVAGKTGTAQKVGPSGTYERDKHVVSFVGFMPAEAPAFVGLVMLDEPVSSREQNYGGVIAAPVFAKIGERAARYLNLTPAPEEPGESGATPAEVFRD